MSRNQEVVNRCSHTSFPTEKLCKLFCPWYWRQNSKTTSNNLHYYIIALPLHCDRQTCEDDGLLFPWHGYHSADSWVLQKKTVRGWTWPNQVHPLRDGEASEKCFSYLPWRQWKPLWAYNCKELNSAKHVGWKENPAEPCPDFWSIELCDNKWVLF